MAKPRQTKSWRRLLSRPASYLERFLAAESAGGMVLMLVTLVTLLAANSPFGAFHPDEDLVLAIDDGLMTVFFLLVSLEIKRELAVGELASPARIALPAVAAAGGMAVPALIYLLFNWAAPTWRGWAIPSATDIAFSLALLSLAPGKAAQSLKIFLAALAILDDLGAILVIAFFYAGDLQWARLGVGAAIILGLVGVNLAGRRRLFWYLPLGLALWGALLHSGLHATLAGVILGLAIPVRTAAGDIAGSPLMRLQTALHPWVSFAIVPLFALVHAGLDLREVSPAMLEAPAVLGITFGLLLGKPLGVFTAGWLFVRAKLGRLPPDADWASFFGVAMLTGIGFTMSLFIGGLAFQDATLELEVRLGVLLGSLAAGCLGLAFLRLVRR